MFRSDIVDCLGCSLLSRVSILECSCISSDGLFSMKSYCLPVHRFLGFSVLQ